MLKDEIFDPKLKFRLSVRPPEWTIPTQIDETATNVVAAKGNGDFFIMRFPMKVAKSNWCLARLQISGCHQILSIVVELVVIVGQLDLDLVLRSTHHSKEIILSICPILFATILVKMLSLELDSRSVGIRKDGVGATEGCFQWLQRCIRWSARTVVQYFPRPPSPLFIQEFCTEISEKCTISRILNLRLTNGDFEVVQDVWMQREMKGDCAPRD